MIVHLKVTPSISSDFPDNLPVPIKFPAKENCFAQEHNTMTRPGIMIMMMIKKEKMELLITMIRGLEMVLTIKRSATTNRINNQELS